MPYLAAPGNGDERDPVSFGQSSAALGVGLGQFFIDENPDAFLEVSRPGDLESFDDHIDGLLGICRQLHFKLSLTRIPLQDRDKADADQDGWLAYLFQELTPISSGP
jgi:hypothetical protein